MEKIRLHIPNITCSHCVMTIKNELNEMEGVRDVQGDPQTKDVVIEFEEPADREATVSYTHLTLPTN